VRRFILDSHPLEVVAGSKLEFLDEEKKRYRRSVQREKVEMVSQRMMAVLLSEREEQSVAIAMLVSLTSLQPVQLRHRQRILMISHW
jgi:hypothetical protein